MSEKLPPIAPATGLRPRYWETVPLKKMSGAEWEALCDGCGKCCLNKIEYEDDGEVAFTRVACRLLDGDTCRCTNYAIRHQFVPECVQLTPKKLEKIAYWLPQTCAYRLVHEGKPLPDWHPLISGDPETVHIEGASVRGWTVPETSVSEDDWENYIIKERP
ncbi:YcgN family cysteine cluster protein [Pseudorhodobacter sp.]|uniref:YcgN family cysteine cluster protein n=1 Tax=Pseudorhodobacter sp. TaxID=1934400 RepID=UPI002AFF4A08|nr:YcgN family cysteine cluster protein [Pseudorhodobacter sp.]